MNERRLAQIEARLERLVEGAFANLFGKKIRAHDIALEVARAMEAEIRAASGKDPRPLAPDQYVIYLHPDVQAYFDARQPSLIEVLSEYTVELATNAGYRLTNAPLIKVLADPKLDSTRLVVRASHTDRPDNSTAVMRRVEVPPEAENPRNPQIIVNGTQTIRLNLGVVNIGRNRDNHVVLDDPYVSRTHIQLRLRFGSYMLFDVQSHSGTFVNDVRVREHQLRSGDVIYIGRTRLIYVEDEPVGESPLDNTEIMDAIDQDDDP